MATATFESLKPELQLMLERMKYTFGNKPWSKAVQDLWEQDIAITAQQLCDTDEKYAAFVLVGLDYLFPFAKFADGAMDGAPGVDGEIAEIMRGMPIEIDETGEEERESDDDGEAVGGTSGYEADRERSASVEPEGAAGEKIGLNEKNRAEGWGSSGEKSLVNEKDTIDYDMSFPKKKTANDSNRTPKTSISSNLVGSPRTTLPPSSK
ncbi:uncharacterized protein K452DRAFT_360181 [Aplosporella prunicola CBS 121167]|uniref:Uncharacterized protein n=1 Tax=Aplosporella prunicola CBS 121167 TaxID=1176127 RepID=A0A6A6B9Q3_9PEZI|nr:uncharacterized protein K452DRAFT_360181 [Aplosporella prunicola CBS 121167]KAF2139964.1 hypothetical protein K452DRAFT_360181 [Aplosporella prunicola CBS 121167]